NDDFSPNIVLASLLLGSESCLPTNRAVDPEETVSVRVTLRNAATGTARATNATATLLAGGGILPLSEPQIYGALNPGVSAARDFTFTAQGNCGDLISAIFVLEDGGLPLGTLTNVFRLGQPFVAFSENFDAAPSLPAGWTTNVTGAGTPWRISTTSRDT